MSEFFKSIPKIAYEGKNSKNPLAFKFYNPDEVIAGKTMREQLKFALSWWHTMGGDGTDMFGCGTTDKTWGCDDVTARAKAKVEAAFEIMDKLSIDYYCFHDRDLSPEYGSLSETNEKLRAIVDLCKEKQDATGKKLLWGTAKCFDHPRYMHGAGTSPSADVFAYAAAQIKSAIDATVKLGGQGYVFWGGREGYETLLNTDMGLELDNMARLMHLAVDYARSIGFTGDFYVEPKPKEPTKHQYDFVQGGGGGEKRTAARKGAGDGRGGHSQGLQAEHRGKPRNTGTAHIPARTACCKNQRYVRFYRRKPGRSAAGLGY